MGMEWTGAFPSMKSAFGSTKAEREGSLKSRPTGNEKSNGASGFVSWVLLRSM